MELKDIPVLILAGGKGTRVQHILKDIPKPLYPVNEVPFLDYLLGYHARAGFKKFYLSIGYRAELFEEYYKGREDIQIIREELPLGTGGAILHSMHSISENQFVVLNGDTLYTIDYRKFIRFCDSKKGFPVIAIKEVPDAGRYGKVIFDEENKIVAFREKGSSDLSNWINAGIYFFHKKNFSEIQLPEVNSIEYDIFPKLVQTGLFAFKSSGQFIDIGTPETLAATVKFIEENRIPSYK